MSLINSWGVPIVPDKNTLLPARTSGGTDGRSTNLAFADGSCVAGNMYIEQPLGILVSAMATSFVQGQLRGGVTWTNDATADFLTVPEAGLYAIIVTGTCQLPSNSSFSASLHVNGVACTLGCTIRESNGAGGAAINDSFAAHQLAALPASAQLSFRVTAVSATVPSVTNVSLSVFRLSS